MDQKIPNYAIVPLAVAEAVLAYLGARPACETGELFIALRTCPVAELPQDTSPVAPSAVGSNPQPESPLHVG